jgi:hypothetical protein
MVFFIFKCYYVLFLHFSKDKHTVPWWNAMLGLSFVSTALLLSIMHLSGALQFLLPDTSGAGPFERRGKHLLFILPFFVLIWYLLKYIIFGEAKASKTDGLSERYAFTPTKRDKIICWLTVLLSLLSIVAAAGIKQLFGE